MISLNIELTVAFITSTLALLQIAQILASWFIYCEAKASKEASVKSKAVTELIRQNTQNLQESFSVHQKEIQNTIDIQHIQRSPVISNIQDESCRIHT